jgi:hypothetical protein
VRERCRCVLGWSEQASGNDKSSKDGNSSHWWEQIQELANRVAQLSMSRSVSSEPYRR